MIRYIIVAFMLTFASIRAYAGCDVTIDGYSYCSMDVTVYGGMTAPSVSNAGEAKMYFDNTLNKLQCSENGGAYADCVGGGGGGAGYATIQDEGSGLTQRTTLNFIGAGVSCVDNAGGLKTDCTIGGSSGSPGGSDTQVQYNSAGSFAGSANFTFDGTNVDTNGTMTANKFILDGFGTAPQIYPSVDTNSGLFFSGPDVLEIHTGGLNGLAINSAQNVGVATHSPTSKLHVYNTSAGNSFEVDDQASDTTPFIIDSTGNVGIGTSTVGTRLSIGAGSTSTNDEMISINSGSGSGAEPQVRFSRNGVLKAAVYVKDPTETLYFYTTGAGDNFTMTQGGNVGISTVAPEARLHILQANAANALEVDDVANDTTPFVITSDGNVGVGSPLPVNKLNVVTAGGTTGLANTESTANLFVDNAVVGTALGLNDSNIPIIQGIVNSTNAARPILLNPYGGNVGIGTSQLPTGVFQIKSTDNAGIILVSGTTNGIRIGTSATDTNVTGVDNTGFATYQPLAIGGSNLKFTIAGVEKMSVATNGNVGVGTVNPTALMEVTQTAAADAFIVEDQATDPSPFVINSNGNVGIGTASAPSKLVINPSGTGDGVQIQTLGNGTAAGSTWRFGLRNAANNDTMAFGQTSSAYTTGGTFTWIGNSTGYLYYPTTFKIGTGVGAASVMHLTSTGNIGIGTSTAPTAVVNIASNADSDLFRVDDSGSGDTSPVVINSVGNIGIGSASPGQKIDVGGTGDKLRMRSPDGTVWNCAPADTTGVFTCT